MKIFHFFSIYVVALLMFFIAMSFGCSYAISIVWSALSSFLYTWLFFEQHYKVYIFVRKPINEFNTDKEAIAETAKKYSWLMCHIIAIFYWLFHNNVKYTVERENVR